MNDIESYEASTLQKMTELTSLHAEGCLHSSEALKALPPLGVLRDLMLERCACKRNKISWPARGLFTHVAPGMPGSMQLQCSESHL